MATAVQPVEQTNYLNADYGIKSWLLTTDHKRIAMLYLISITFFFWIGGLFAMLVRLELLTPAGDLMQADTYNKVFTMHGITMVFFFLIPSVPAVLGNFLVPLMIGAKDLAFPRINLLSWYIYVAAGCLWLYTIVNGGIDTGWTFYTPLSTAFSNTHVITGALSVFIAGFSSIFTGLNFIVTIHRMRAPGMTWQRLPLFLWSNYASGGHHGAGHAGAGDHAAAGGAGARLQHRRLQPATGRRPASVPAPLLVLLASGGVHHDPARHGRHQRNRGLFFAQAGIRL